jgi:hypothetical protein
VRKILTWIIYQITAVPDRLYPESDENTTIQRFEKQSLRKYVTSG